MAKRFIDPDWKALRKLSPNLQRAFFYCWDKADACGVYEHDQIYMKADLSITLTISDLSKLPGAKVLPGEKIFFCDFIRVNYGTLKDGYNPHKPVFRALQKNKISSLDEACRKLKDEEEDKEEEEGEDVLKPLAKIFTKPSLQQVTDEMQNGFEAEKFFNYYESNGWRVGKNPMKNWQAAAKNWLKNSKNYATSSKSFTGSVAGIGGKSAGAHELANLLKDELSTFQQPGG